MMKPKIKFPVTNNTLYWADMWLWQAEIWTHNAKYDKDKEHCLRVAEYWKSKVNDILSNGWKDNPNIVYATEGMKPKHKLNLNDLGLHRFPIYKQHKTSHKRKAKELKPQPQCQCKHYTYDHKNAKCMKCACNCFTL